MRIAMVIQRFRPLFSGQGEQVGVLSRELARRGHDLTVLTAAYDRPSDVEESDGIRYVRLRSALPLFRGTGFGRRWHSPMFAAQVFGYLVTHPSFDIVHVHALTDALYASWVWGRLEERPVVFEMTLDGVDDAATLLSRRQRLQRFRNRVVRSCDGYVAISPTLEAAHRTAGLPADKLRLIPQGVDVERFRPSDDKLAVRRDLALPETGPLVVFVGSLIHRKGLDVLLRSWSAVRASRPDAHLVLVGRDRFGDRDATAFLETQFAALAPWDRASVHRLGVREEIHRFMQAADVFVFPSRREGFGTVMVEAMACGLPCVVTELPGITDFIFGASGERGLIVPQKDDRALAAAVVSVLADPARAARIGCAARDEVVGRFAITALADQYLRFYRDLLSDQGDRSVV